VPISSKVQAGPASALFTDPDVPEALAREHEEPGLLYLFKGTIG